MAYEASQRDLDPRATLSDSYHSNATTTRIRASSNTSNARNDPGMQDHTGFKPQVPINEAVVSAFDKAETANHVPPELIAQITESVIKQLKASGISDSNTPVPQTNAYPPPPVQQPAPQSPSTMSGSSPPIGSRNVYTPPSPHKHPQYPSGSPQAPHQSFPPPQSPTRDRPTASFQDRSTSSPLSQSSTASLSPTRPKGPERLSTGTNETTLEKIWGPLFDEHGDATKRLRQLLQGLAIHIIEDYEPQHSIVITPSKMAKYYQDVKLPNERYPWSIIFDDEQSSISRMFRQLECSHHLIQDRLDERPDVPGLTPVGFQQWMTHLLVAHPEEEYQRLCKAVLSMPISNPDDKKERFPKELSRRLFPNHEDKQIQDRLAEAMIEHCHVDIPRRGSQESLPSRKPTTVDSQTSNASHRPSIGQESGPPPRNIERERAPYAGTPSAGTAMDCAVDDSSTAPIPNQGHRGNVAAEIQPGTSSNIERERKPYSGIPSESHIDDTNPIPNPSMAPGGKPIERERKPYSVQPGAGGGKIYDDELRDAGRLPQRNDPIPGPGPSPQPSIHRADSISSGRNGPRTTGLPPPGRPRPMSTAGNFQRPPPMDMPKPEIHQQGHHARRLSNVPRSRHRSPSFSRVRDDTFRRSDGEFTRYGPQAGSVPLANGFDDGRYARWDRDRERDRAAAAAAAAASARGRGGGGGGGGGAGGPVDDMGIYGASPAHNRPPRGGPPQPPPPPPPPLSGGYGMDEDFYRGPGRPVGNGYDYDQPYGGPLH